MSAFPASPFELRSVYDAPSVVFKQILDGELTARGTAAAFFDPLSMTLQERDTLAQSIKEKAGAAKPIVGAMADVFLNPWVWAAFILPAGAPAALKAGNRLFEIPFSATGAAGRDPGLFQRVGLASHFHWLDRSGVNAETVLGFTRTYDKMLAETKELDVVAAAVAQANDLPTLDMSSPLLQKDVGLFAKAQRINNLMSLHLMGAAKVRKSAGQTLQPYIKDNAKLQAAIDATPGLRAYVKATERFRDLRKTQLFGKEAAKGFEIDSDKVQRLWDGLYGNELLKKHHSTDVTSAREALYELFDATSVDNLLADTTLSREEFGKKLAALVADDLPDFYMPRNLRTRGQVAQTPDGRWTVDDNPLNRTQGGRSARLIPGYDVRPRQAGEAFWHPEDLLSLRDTASEFGATPELNKLVLDNEARIQKAFGQVKEVSVFRMNPTRSMSKYGESSARTYGLFVEEVPAFELEAYGKFVRANKGSLKTTGLDEGRWHAAGGRVTDDPTTLTREMGPAGGFSRAALLKGGWAMQQSPAYRAYYEEGLVPLLRGQTELEPALLTHVALKARETTAAFLSTSVAASIAEGGDLGKGFIKRLQDFSESPVRYGAADRKAVGWLFSAAMGMNASSAIVNLMQPAAYGVSYLGVGPILEGYRKAIPAVMKYVSLRLQEGAKLSTPETKARLAKEAFGDIAEVANIGPSLLEQMDITLLSQANRVQGPRSLMDKVIDVSMSLFEKAEWTNRAVMAHATEAAMRNAGKPIRDASGRLTKEAIYNVERMVGATQFASTDLEIPMMFTNSNPKFNATGRIFQSPLMRQFLGFPMRSVGGLALTSPAVGARGGMAIASDFFKGMGTSAVVYEVMKNLTGSDMSRGLFFSSITDLVPGIQGGRYDTRDGALPLPPVIDIPWSVIQSAGDPNLTIMGHVAPRLIPGGVALSRALGVLPDLPDTALAGLPGSLQKTTVDWAGMTPDGQVPVFKRDGTLQMYASPTLLMARALGVDMGKFTQESDLTGAIMKNSEQSSAYEREYLRKLHANDISGAQATAQEHMTRFGIPLTITQQQMRSFNKGMTVPRTERVLDRMNPEMRGAWGRVVANQQPGNVGDPATFAEGGTSGSRERNAPATPQLSPEAIRVLMEQEVRKQQAGAAAVPFDNFGAF